MKLFCRLLLLATVFFLLFPFVSSEASTFREVKQVSGSQLAVKELRDPEATTLAMLGRGDFVTVFSTASGWSSIQAGNVKGFVNASFLATPKSTIKIASSKSGLVVKATPSRSAATLATLKYNMIVEDFGAVGAGWSFVQYGNVTGYVVSSFIGTPKTATKYVNSAGGVVVRNIASQSGANIGLLSNGTEVKVHSTIAGWAYVTAGNTKGYVVASFLSTKKPIVQVTGGLLPTRDFNVSYDFYTNGKYTDTRVGMITAYNNAGAVEFEPYESFIPHILYDTISKGFMWTAPGVYAATDYNERATYPLYVGKTWAIDYYGVVRQNYRVLSIGSLMTKAGNFTDVVKIRVSYDRSKEVNDYYFAKGYGIIRQDRNNVLQYIIARIQ